ncbi:acyl-CoA dehydrogenase family protein [Nocardia nova]|uniref:acyl-CoA dehydrogenase family protein n=1 Tax=Nocardia nova TaxID=37330 RepID=UPI001CA4CE1E|nr:acyl-CoA dehydrogenase family protein [Nocardia nova]
MTMAPSGLDAEAIELLSGTLRGVFADRTKHQDLEAALAELGWEDVVSTDPATAIDLLFSEHGRALATSRLLDSVVLDVLAPALSVAGTKRAVLYCSSGIALALGSSDGVGELVAIDGAGTVRLFPAETVDLEPVRGFDDDSPWFRASNLPDTGEVSVGEVGTTAVAAARRALCAEIIGACATVLDLATAHTSTRVQYGRPLATFQAVRHRLAESYVAIEGARAALRLAWDEGSESAALLAKLRAGRAQAEVMRHVVQVFGAMGLTREHDAHRYVTRTAVLDQLLGSHTDLAEEIGAALLKGAAHTPPITL